MFIYICQYLLSQHIRFPLMEIMTTLGQVSVTMLVNLGMLNMTLEHAHQWSVYCFT